MINPKEKSYRNIKQTQDVSLKKKAFLNKYLGVNKWLIPYLTKEGIVFKGKMLELGTGAAWCSTELSKIQMVEKIYALDISQGVLKSLAPKMVKYLGGNSSKINFILGDMHKLNFPKEMFDLVIFSASLHHATKLFKVLKEANRVLKRDGLLLALNEPIAPELILFKEGKFYWRRKEIRESIWNEPEDWGGPRHIYAKKEWQKIFRDSGFTLSFTPYLLGITFIGKIVKYSPLSLLNGKMFFSLFQMIAKKAKV